MAAAAQSMKVGFEPLAQFGLTVVATLAGRAREQPVRFRPVVMAVHAFDIEMSRVGEAHRRRIHTPACDEQYGCAQNDRNEGKRAIHPQAHLA